MQYHLLLRSEEEVALLKVEMSSVIAFHNHQWNTLFDIISKLMIDAPEKRGLLCLLQEKRLREEETLKQLSDSYAPYIDLPTLPVDKFFRRMQSIICTINYNTYFV